MKRVAVSGLLFFLKRKRLIQLKACSSAIVIALNDHKPVSLE